MTSAPTSAGQRGRTAGKAQAIVLLMGACLPVVGLMVISPVLPQIIRQFEDTPGVDALAPLTLTVPALSLAILSPFAGRIIDRTGRLRLLYVSLALYAVMGTAPLWLDSLSTILISRVLLGVTEAAIMTCCLTLIGDYYHGRERDRWMALHTPYAAVAAVIFLAAGGAVGSSGWRAPFWLYAIALVLLIAMLPLLWEPARSAEAPATRAPLPRLQWRLMMPLLVLTLLSALVFYTVVIQQSIVLDAVGSGSAAIGLAAAIANVGIIAGSLTFARLARRGASPLLVIGLLLAAAGLVGMSLGDTAVLITAAATVAGFGGGMLLPALLIGTTARLRFAQRGRGTAAWNSTFWFGQFLSPFVVVAFTAATGTLDNALHVMAVLGLVVAGAAFAVTRRRPLETSAEILTPIPDVAGETAVPSDDQRDEDPHVIR